MKLENAKINFLGDSITQSVGASETEKGYVSLVAQMTGATCRNYGLSGTRIAKQKFPSPQPHEDLDFCLRAKDMDNDADIVIVFGGTNDYGHGDAPIGKFSDETQDTFYGGLHTLCRSLIEKFSDSYIIFITPLHRTDEEVSTDPRKLGQSEPLIKYVNAVREVAEYYSLPVIDFYSDSGIQPNVPIIQEKFMPDGLHPNDAGHKILAKKITAFLKSTVV